MSIALLGSPVITVDGLPLRVDTRKATAVLAVLAVDGPSSRTTLAARLWPDSDDAHARGALRRTLSVLGSALAGRWVVTSSMLLTLEEAGTTSDVRTVSELRSLPARHQHPAPAVCADCVAPLRAAAALHRGEFLCGFTLRGGDEFEAWRAMHAERLRWELCRVLERSSRAEAEHGDLDAAVAATRRWLQVDRFSEEAYSRAMLLHARRGDRAEAMRTYRECVAVLRQELDVAPLAQTTALHRAIADGRFGRDGGHRWPGHPSPAGWGDRGPAGAAGTGREPGAHRAAGGRRRAARLAAARTHLEAALALLWDEEPAAAVRAAADLAGVLAEAGALDHALDLLHATLARCEDPADRRHARALRSSIGDLRRRHGPGAPRRLPQPVQDAVELLDVAALE